MKTRKNIIRVICLSLLALLLVSCGKTVNESAYLSGDGVILSKNYTPDGSDAPGAADGYALKDGISYSVAEAGEAVYEDEPVIDGPGGYNGEKGILTAGMIKDFDDASGFRNTLLEKWGGFALERSLNSGNVIVVKITSDSAPVFNEKVELYHKSAQETKLIWGASSDVNGKAVLFYKDEDKGEMIIKAGGTENAFDTEKDGDTLEFDISSASSAKPAKLDLLFMVDTTGSMSDELEFLKKDLADIVDKVKKGGQINSDESFTVRVSVNFYRDEGDDYVVKYYDFRDDVEACIPLLEEEFADGGGDFPEAVHTALDCAVAGHSWNLDDGDNVKLCFIVLDAPPHSEEEIEGINAGLLESVRTAAERGIRIIPVASSGIDDETEFLLRSYALMTGGTYIFLTDDSGVGNGHLEPTDKDTDIYTLNDCITKTICEYCGIDFTETEPVQTQETESETETETEYHQ